MGLHIVGQKIVVALIDYEIAALTFHFRVFAVIEGMDQAGRMTITWTDLQEAVKTKWEATLTKKNH